MEIATINGVTRVLGESQGFLGLPIRDEVVENHFTDGTTAKMHVMLSAWLPTPAELEALNKGAAVVLSLHGVSHPPVMISVGLPPLENQETKGTG